MSDNGLACPNGNWARLLERARRHPDPSVGAGLLHEDTPTAVLVRQVLGAIAQFEKTSLVAMLKAARDRKKAATGKCGGRKTYAEARPDVVLLAKQMHDQGMSLRKISAELAARGYVTAGGRPYVASAVQTMLGLRGRRVTAAE